MTDQQTGYAGRWPLIFGMILLFLGGYWWLSRDKKPENKPESTPTTANTAPVTGVVAEIQKRGYLIVGMEPDSPPMYYTNNGTKRGLDMELIENLASRIGVNRIHIVEADYDELPDLAKSGKIDAFMSGYIPDDSIDGIVWGQDYLEFGFCLLVKQGSKIRSIKDLKGASIGIYDDEVAADWVKENVNDYQNLVKYQGVGWLRHLVRNEVDAIIYDYPFAVEEIKIFPELRIVELNLNKTSYAIGFPKRNAALKTALDDQLNSFLNSAAYERMVQQYLSSDALDVVSLPSGSKTYVVKRGDNLGKIAEEVLHDGKRWREIWELNKNRLANPHLITPGFNLVIP